MFRRVVDFIVMRTTDGFIIAVAQGKLVASTNYTTGAVKTQVVGRQFHATVDLTVRIHAVQFCANLNQSTGCGEYFFIAVNHQAVAHNNFIVLVRNVN